MGMIQRWLGFDRDANAQPLDGESPFDAIRHTDRSGEHWFARELAVKLGYNPSNDWRYFVAVVKKAKSALDAIGLISDDHIRDATGMIEIGKGGHREVEDFRLDRRACYMVAICGDPRKPEVAAAKNYFIVKTRQAELGAGNAWAGRKLTRWVKQGKEIDWIIAKIKTSEPIRKVFCDALHAHDVGVNGIRNCTITITKEVVGKRPAQIRKERNIKKYTRDGLSIHELAGIAFAESLSTQAIENGNLAGDAQCHAACKTAAVSTRQAIDKTLNHPNP